MPHNDHAFDADASIGTASNKRLRAINPASLAGLAVPERQWLVADWVQIARATAFYGAGGEGKTILAQMLATACAVGKSWLGLPTMRCNSVLLFCEDDLDEMHRRQEDINTYYGCAFADLDPMLWLPRLGDDNALMEFDGGRVRHTALFDELLATAKDHRARLVVHDTLADVFVGNENDRGQARAFGQQAIGLIAREINGAAVALAHPSRAGMNSGSGDSGSTGWVGTFRSQLYLATPRTDDDSEPTDSNLRTLTRRKSNAARRGDEIELRWQNGVFVPTRETGILGWIERKSAKRVFLSLLDRVMEEGRHVSENSHSSNYAPMLFARRPDREGFRVGDFKRAMEELFAERAIKIGTYRGSNRTDYQCIMRSAQ